MKCCIKGLGRMDLVHILAFQALTFWRSLRQSTYRTLYSTSMCFSKERDYMILLRTYICTTTDSIGILKRKVLEHYSSISAALCYWLIDGFPFYLFRVLLSVLCMFVQAYCLLCIFVFLLMWRINVFIGHVKKTYVNSRCGKVRIFRLPAPLLTGLERSLNV